MTKYIYFSPSTIESEDFQFINSEVIDEQVFATFKVESVDLNDLDNANYFNQRLEVVDLSQALLRVVQATPEDCALTTDDYGIICDNRDIISFCNDLQMHTTDLDFELDVTNNTELYIVCDQHEISRHKSGFELKMNGKKRFVFETTKKAMKDPDVAMGLAKDIVTFITIWERTTR